MILNDYQKLASRTMAFLDNKAVNGAHMALGITTELGEMEKGMLVEDIVNIKEEHGDCNWYIANECNIYGLEFSFLYQCALDNHKTMFELHELVDLHKKELAYGKEINSDDLVDQLIFLFQYLQFVSSYYGFTYEESLERNIEKLTARYPEKFTSEQALIRDLQKEREILEK